MAEEKKDELKIQTEKLTGVMSAKQVGEIVQANNEKMGEILGGAIQKMAETIKAPTKAEARKQKQEEFLLRQANEARLQEAIESEKVKLDREAACASRGHQVKAVGNRTQHGFRGNMNSDGAFRPQCINCWKAFPPIKGSQSMVTGQVSVNDYLTSIQNLTEEMLVKASKDSYPEYWAHEEKKRLRREEKRSLWQAETVTA